ncbi:helix-turn-helix domain-containing protein [Pseudonocardia nematodicida]|uniref:Helix-turn-helix domain-containing protein n=1 Tax=Pseudonocardia nematodicida TaxID=1206997 RepID=A0ABV1KHQ4_9PSEU
MGLLLVIDAEHGLSAAEIADVELVGDRVAALLAGRAAAGDRERAARAATVRRILSADPAERRAAVGDLDRLGLAVGPHLSVTVVEVRGHPPGAGVEPALWSVTAGVGDDTAVAVHGGRAEIVRRDTAAPTPADLRARAARQRDAVLRVLGGPADVVVGTGGVVGSPSGLYESGRQASVAVRAGHRLPHLGGVGVWDELGEYAVLLCVPDDVPPGHAGARALGRLAAHDTGSRLRETLRVFLDEAGSVPRAARALHLHRTSLHYRLRRIREITGLDLDDGRDRLLLHMQLRLEETTGSGRPVTPAR